MNQLFVITFEAEDAALDAMRSLRRLEKEGQVHFEDTAVVTRDADGKAHVKNELSGRTETGAAIGGMIGMFIGGLLFPVVGLALGAAIGGAIAASTHTGVDGDFVKEVREQLTPGTSALFLVTQSVYAGALVAALRPYTGTLLQTTVDEELEATLREALK